MSQPRAITVIWNAAGSWWASVKRASLLLTDVAAWTQSMGSHQNSELITKLMFQGHLFFILYRNTSWFRFFLVFFFIFQRSCVFRFVLTVQTREMIGLWNAFVVWPWGLITNSAPGIRQEPHTHVASSCLRSATLYLASILEWQHPFLGVCSSVSLSQAWH